MRKKLITIALLSFFLCLMIAIPASASMLIPSGGWLIDDTVRIRTFTNMEIYRIAAERITGYLDDGFPLSETITSVDYPFNPDQVALGFRNCLLDGKVSKGLISIQNFESKSTVKTWDFDGKKITEIQKPTITCNWKELER